jgi:valyl-tRNA synthetase
LDGEILRIGVLVVNFVGDIEFLLGMMKREISCCKNRRRSKVNFQSQNPSFQYFLMQSTYTRSDVLDTWFSSWLWPMEVFGWNKNKENNEELDYYYPTATLVTAPEIIFFWVARMIMAGLEYRKQIPFKQVYFTGIVRDKQGRKMSKSLGNSPDLLELD